MKDTDKILQMAKDNKGIVTSRQVVDNGFSRATLKHLVDLGRLEKSDRGVYVLPDAWDDDYISVQTRYKRGIFSLNTALYLLDLSDRTPNRINMTFPKDYNLTNVKGNDIICSTSKKENYDLGIIEVETPFGHKVKCYNAEKTLCDILVPRNKVNIEIITTAFKTYARREDKDLLKLTQYAKQLKVEQKVQSYMEVLL